MRLLVLSMTTWGEMGNWLSGRTLTQALSRRNPDWTVTQLPVDRLVPALADVGGRIRRVTMESGTPSERFAGYSRIMRDLLAEYPGGMEQAASLPPALRERLEPLRSAIEQHTPDMIVGTKGLICRLAIAASGSRVPVVNYVTNHGHFEFDVHDCPGAAAHLARTDAGAAFLRSRRNYPAERIAVVGYLIAAPRVDPQEAGAEGAPPAEPLHFVVVSNRGGREYLDVLGRLLEHRRRPAGTFIALNDPVLCGGARELIAASGQSERWSVLEKLEHEDFVRMLSGRARAGCIALVTKASPNSIMEAVYLGIPMFLFRSGLPMEDWSCDLVTESGFGAVAESPGELWAAIEAALDTDGRLEAISAQELDYARRVLDQGAVLERIGSALERVHAAHGGRAMATRAS